MVNCFFFFCDATGAVQGQHHNGVAASASASAVSGSDKAPAATAGADYGHDSAGISASGKTGTPMMVQKHANYDEIFNVRAVCDGGDVVDTHTPNNVLLTT